MIKNLSKMIVAFLKDNDDEDIQILKLDPERI